MMRATSSFLDMVQKETHMDKRGSNDDPCTEMADHEINVVRNGMSVPVNELP